MSKETSTTQLELEIARLKEPDRNLHKGGRSFYFFDFDDNVVFLTTSIFIFHKETKAELALSTGEFAHVSQEIGKTGLYRDYTLDFDDQIGSFRRFRDAQHSVIEKLLTRKRQPFIEDVLSALTEKDVEWKGPSWSCFYHAVFNQRPMSIITARGHDPKTIEEGISNFAKRKHLPTLPNYLSIFPVSHIKTREALGDVNRNWSVATLKKAAIRASVDKAITLYGYSPFHRFGMSDDDPRNLDLIYEAMAELKRDYPDMSFFVINTHKAKFVKQEVYADHIESKPFTAAQQLELF